MKRIFPICLAALTLLSARTTAEVWVSSSVNRNEIGMGESVSVTTTVSTGRSDTRGGFRVIPFVDGKRWGAIEETNASGVTVHDLPLPNPGIATIEMRVEAPLTRGERASWIWGDTVPESSTQYFQRAFQFTGDPASARLWVAADDSAEVFLNGESLGTVNGWTQVEPLQGLAEHLVSGENVLSLAAASTKGLAGLLVRLDQGPDTDSPIVLSGEDWTFFRTPPYGWPFRAEVDGNRPMVLAGAAWSPYRETMDFWPTLPDRALAMVGTLKPEEGLYAKPLTVQVRRRTLKRPPANPERRIGIQFEPWFTPGNARWTSTQAIPLTGRYWSWNPDVQRQQMIWLIESGIDFLVVDWTNHLWGKEHWDERGSNTNEIIHATTMLLDTLASMEAEGHVVPNVVLYLGLNNGPSTTVGALNEALNWIHHTYVRNPRFANLFEYYQEKPLALVHNGAGPAWVDKDGQSKADDTHFTIRYQSFHHEHNDHADFGFWSWMDASLKPVPTRRGDDVEALTVSTAFFGPGGWKKDGAHGRQGGWTLMESFRSALEHQPRYLQLHQYQAFSGQWEGYGYGPARDLYLDSYSVPLSDDLEPVSRTAAAYRGTGGWGFYYLNLARALIDLYRQPEPETTVVLLSQPEEGARLTGDLVEIAWDWIGKEPEGLELRINGVRVDIDPEVPHLELDLSSYKSGPMEISITALGTRSRYALGSDVASLPDETLPPASMEISCLVDRE